MDFAQDRLPDSVRHFRVVVAVIEHDGRFLITQRRSTGKLGGLWEFPGGKVEPGETDEAALNREIRERMGVDVRVGCRKARRIHQYVGYSVDLVLYEASIPPDQEPRPLRVADLRWVAPHELEQYPFPPADQATTDQLLDLGFC